MVFYSIFLCVFLFSYLKKMVEVLEKSTLEKIIVIFLILFFVMTTVVNIDIFYIGMGYSPLWIAILYVIGAYIKKYDIGEDMKAGKGILIFFGCVIAGWVVRNISDLIVHIELNGTAYGAYFTRSSSPFIFVASVVLVIMFSKIKPGKVATGGIKLFAPLVFGVHLIHTEPMIWKGVFKDRFFLYSRLGIVSILPAVIGTAIAIWLVCSVADLVRFYIFKLLKIRKLSEKIEEAIAKK